MNNYHAYANSVIINDQNQLISFDSSLMLVGGGRSAFVFRIKSTQRVIKVYFPNLKYIAQEEAEIYQMLQGIDYYPTLYDSGVNYIVIDFIEGKTLFENVTLGNEITAPQVKEIDLALSLASNKGLNPSDIHLRNIIITPNGDIKIIDVARYRQSKECMRWNHIKKFHRQFYRKCYFPKKVSARVLDGIGNLYKKGLIPFYRD
ncbi:protein kinase family protein [Psychrobacillus sp. FJAT-51614]|uniref:Protein kinase family protein n=1 Tax=Psychrobacillus mangrovi TaxID=3117745 RepID=A0ABU8F290_9BACI